MNFKNFSINYLNPFYLLWRVMLFVIVFYVFIIIQTKDIIISGTMVIVSLILSVIIINILTNKRWFILYFMLPTILIVSAYNTKIIILGLIGICIVLWNAIRPWSSGASLNDLQEKVDDLNSKY